MKYTLLHISDIHKGNGADLNNLFSSLTQDCDKYSYEGIEKPSIIVVSGDVINGAEGNNAIAEIRKQYEEVSEFLTNLVDYFLDGDKQRIIIVPGNHDFCREYSKSSMTPSESDKSDDAKALWRVDPDVRWSWKDFQFHKITTRDVYINRFTLFTEFYNKFYDGIRSISEPAEEYSDLVDFPQLGISFVLFNSCYQLDHLNVSGTIFPSAVTRLSSQLNLLHKKGRLLIAVWHHHTMGLPSETNYLDYRVLQVMLANHIHMGLYGHQHKAQIINTYSDIDEEETMLLISSGSLYGRRKELATGFSRQYNLITIEKSDASVKVCVNVRSDQHPDYEIPLWTLGTVGTKGKLRYSKEIKLYQPSKEELLMEVDDKARRSNDYETAVKELIALGPKIPRYNDYLDEYLTKANFSPDEIIELISTPASEAQAIHLISAAKETKRQDVKDRIKSDLYINMSTSSIVKDLLANL